MMYMVTRWGVYQQGTVGIFFTMGEARAALFAAKEKERDDYHVFEINEIEVGVTREPSRALPFVETTRLGFLKPGATRAIK